MKGKRLISHLTDTREKEEKNIKPRRKSKRKIEKMSKNERENHQKEEQTA